MDVLTEPMLRALYPVGGGEHRYARGTYVTETARRYAAEKNIRLTEASYDTMTGDATKKTPGKPEEKTHIRAGVLVDKTHPRIALRGKLDSLQAETLLVLLLAKESGKAALYDGLSEILQLLRKILAAEVKEETLEDWQLLGLTPDALRKTSHHGPHFVPDVAMGRLALALNRLRALVRETELAALCAFPDGARPDIELALNRMSSAVYILFQREVAENE